MALHRAHDAMTGRMRKVSLQNRPATDSYQHSAAASKLPEQHHSCAAPACLKAMQSEAHRAGRAAGTRRQLAGFQRGRAGAQVVPGAVPLQPEPSRNGSAAIHHDDSPAAAAASELADSAPGTGQPGRQGTAALAEAATADREDAPPPRQRRRLNSGAAAAVTEAESDAEASHPAAVDSVQAASPPEAATAAAAHGGAGDDAAPATPATGDEALASGAAATEAASAPLQRHVTFADEVAPRPSPSTNRLPPARSPACGRGRAVGVCQAPETPLQPITPSIDRQNSRRTNLAPWYLLAGSSQQQPMHAVRSQGPACHEVQTARSLPGLRRRQER